jgi:hypothetical protein
MVGSSGTSKDLPGWLTGKGFEGMYIKKEKIYNGRPKTKTALFATPKMKNLKTSLC